MSFAIVFILWELVRLPLPSYLPWILIAIKVYYPYPCWLFVSRRLRFDINDLTFLKSGVFRPLSWITPNLITNIKKLNYTNLCCIPALRRVIDIVLKLKNREIRSTD